ncbi:hypothetical protein GCM10011416_09310 [Polaribacter pacificus]|uniref:MORN repeat variant n=1 Tax=Polaribacter pacificus TaxID=1775173 RepID=A0A917HXI7_9FLAO|nr:nicotinic acid mononucleotide adenyltransferase [Polaribacter pacificus]GGG94151.1 hypothetical protein GCM10011416_09310 [Polaribacter pacificus]
MKKIATLILVFAVAFTYAQEKSPVFEKAGDLVKATYFYEDGSVKEQGFFKDKKLTGQWVQFDQQGNKTMIAQYKEGNKVGRWFSLKGNLIKEINFQKNVIVSVKSIDRETVLALNND